MICNTVPQTIAVMPIADTPRITINVRRAWLKEDSIARPDQSNLRAQQSKTSSPAQTFGEKTLGFPPFFGLETNSTGRAVLSIRAS